MSTFSSVYKPYTFWDTPLPPKEYTSTFLSVKNPHENNKNQAKKLKVYGKSVDLYGLYTLMKMLTFMDGP